MKRHEFFHEIGDSLFQTFKSVYEPFIQSDLEKIEGAAERALGISWVSIIKETEIASAIEMKFTNNIAIIIAREGANIQAWSGICPVCSQIISLSTLYPTGKCLNCLKEFNFKNNLGELPLHCIPIRKKGQFIQIGVMKGE